MTEQTIIEAVGKLQVTRDEELVDAASSIEAQALLAAILDGREPSNAVKAPPRRWWRGRRTTLLAAAGALVLAGGAGALLARHGDEGPPTRNELRAGASNGVLDRSVTYVDVPVRGNAAPADLQRRFADLGFDIELRLVPASPLLQGRILSASGHGGGELIRELSRDCPRAVPCGKFGLKVPSDFNGDATIVMGRAAKPKEPYVFVQSFQSLHPYCVAIGGLRVSEAEEAVASRLGGRANPLWFDVDTGRTYDDPAPIGDKWVVDALRSGGYLDKPSRSRPPRVVLAVASKPVPAPAPISSGSLEKIQRVIQIGC